MRLYKLQLGFLSFGHRHYRKPFVFQFPSRNQIFDDNSMSQRETDFVSFHLLQPCDALELSNKLGSRCKVECAFLVDVVSILNREEFG